MTTTRTTIEFLLELRVPSQFQAAVAWFQMTGVPHDDWPPEIEIEEASPDRVLYRLPMRDFGRLRNYAWIIAAALVAISFLCMAPQLPFLQPGPWHPLGFMFALVVAGLFGLPAFYVLSFLLCHCEIEIRDGELLKTEQAGLFRRRRRWPLARLKRLQVMGLAGPSTGTSLRRQSEVIVAQYQSSRARRRLGTDEPIRESNRQIGRAHV